MVARICEALSLRGDERVLDVGTGSGYQAAVLAELAGEVAHDRAHPRARRGGARERSRPPATATGSASTSATGRAACPSARRSTRSPSRPLRRSCPATLYEQLEPRGRLVVPVGGRRGQRLELIVRSPEGPAIVRSVPCRFVPLLGEEGFSA